MNAEARLELSRSRLRQAMIPPVESPSGEAAGGSSPWLGRLRHQPTFALLIDTLQGWWAQHPIRAAAHVAGSASQALAKPIAQRHPLMLVLIAALAGSVFAWSRPWRWALKPALFAGLMPQLISRVVSTLPLESWLSAFTVPPSAQRGDEPQRNSP